MAIYKVFIFNGKWQLFKMQYFTVLWKRTNHKACKLVSL